MKYLKIVGGSIIVLVAVLFSSILCEEYSYYSENYDIKTYDDHLIYCLKIEKCTVENTNHISLCSISYRFIDIKIHEFKKNIKIESKYRPICYKSNLDGKDMIKNAPSFLSHLHFATSDQNADRGCKNKYL